MDGPGGNTQGHYLWGEGWLYTVVETLTWQDAESQQSWLGKLVQNITIYSSFKTKWQI